MLNPEHSDFLADIDKSLQALRVDRALSWLQDVPVEEAEARLAQFAEVYADYADGPTYGRNGSLLEFRRSIWVAWPPTGPV